MDSVDQGSDDSGLGNGACALGAWNKECKIKEWVGFFLGGKTLVWVQCLEIRNYVLMIVRFASGEWCSGFSDVNRFRG